MTDGWGIDAEYDDATGARRLVDPATIDALRASIGRPTDDARGPLVVRPGTATSVGGATLHLEDGATLEVVGSLPHDVPFGYHRLETDAGSRHLIVSPGVCRLPDKRAWGFAVQLYAARSRRSWGLGDLGDLGALARWSRDDLGAGFLLTNPMHAGAPVPPVQPSPYFPATRCFRSPIYLCVDDVEGASEVPDAWAGDAADGRALNDDPLIDRDAVWRAKVGALDAIWRHVRDRSDAHRDWARHQPASLDEFATWSALTERHGANWRVWPAELRDPASGAVTAFASAHRDRLDFHRWLQWCCATQFAAASGHLAVLQDLPVGFDPDGFDAWRWQDLVAHDASIGAPPDVFNTKGQDWGLPPFIPWRLRACGYAPFVESLRATMPANGGLRIDHVMGLFRLWWVPRDAGAAAGAYVRYPAEDLLDIVALESHRAGAVVVGEDLGTVEPGVRETLADHGIMSYRLLWFEDGAPQEWPSMSMGAVTTHDLPTVRGLFTGADDAAQRAAGVDVNEAATDEIRERLARAMRLAPDADEADVVVGAHRRLADAPSLLLSATLDDAALAVERPNIPEADQSRPNWSLALATPIEELVDAPAPQRIADALRTAVVDTPR